MFATIDGVRFNYQDRNEASETALLLIHGFPLDRRLWAAQVNSLVPDVRVIVPDLRGHGKTTVTPGPLTMEQHADDLAALLDRLRIRRAIIGGLSMGGYIALAFWRRHPARVQALILADTKAEPDSVAARVNRDAAIAKVQQVGAAAYADEMLPRLLGVSSLATPKLVATARTMMAEQPVPGIVGTLGGLRDRTDSRPTLPTIAVPTLVLVGEQDALTPPADAQALAAAIPGARLAVIPGAGHLSPLENPRAVNAALRGFINELRKP